MKNIEIPWCLKYVGLPLSIVAVLYKVGQKISQRKSRANLRGKVVVVTGASSGIGEALAHAFYDHGSKVVLAARREHELNRVKDELLSKKLSVPSPEPVVLKLDLADLDSLELFIQKVYDICGDIDILINNGGVSHRGAILHTKTEVDKKIMYIDYFGPVYLTKAVLPKMVKLRKGHIVFISSVQGRVALPDRSAYAAAKHAMQAFGDSLRAEMDQHNINVTVVSPGYVKTAVSMNALSGSGDNHGVMDKNTAAGFTPEYTAEQILNSVASKEDELVISQFIGKFAIFVRYFSPTFYFYIMAKRANKTSLE